MVGPLSHGERVGVRGYGPSTERNPSPGSPEAIRPLPMGEVTERVHPVSVVMYPILVQCIPDCGIERLQALLEIALQMHAQAALGQHVEIAARLCCLDDSKARLLTWHRQILGIVGRDLQEHATVGAALVGLA